LNRRAGRKSRWSIGPGAPLGETAAASDGLAARAGQAVRKANSTKDKAIETRANRRNPWIRIDFTFESPGRVFDQTRRYHSKRYEKFNFEDSPTGSEFTL
jgi:hypothetical protein